MRCTHSSLLCWTHTGITGGPTRLTFPSSTRCGACRDRLIPETAWSILATCTAAEMPHVEPFLATEPRLRAISVPPGHGYDQKKNYGARHAEGEFVLFADGDCEYPENWVEEMVAAFERGGPRVAAVQGRSCFSDGPHSRFLDVLYWASYRPEGPLRQMYSAHNLAIRRDLVPRSVSRTRRYGPDSSER